jgi:cyclopropane fatty-acyl-phospholipid synthase-like methyltransferase
VSDARYTEAVAAYYRDKTSSIIDKYGPGPKIHFHTGLATVDEAHEACGSGDVSTLRATMTRGQERPLEHVGAHAPVPVAGRVLEIGCGLGGGALFWAGEPEVTHVSAITIEPTHVAVTAQMAERAGVQAKVDARLLDAHDVEPAGDFDHAFAIESSCYVDRARWAHATRKALRPGGSRHIVDCFRAEHVALPWFDDYWRTRLGTRSEYERELEFAGFREIAVEDLAQAAVPFWDVSCAWIERAIAFGRERDAKLRQHRRLQRALRSGELQYLRITARL